MLDRSNMSDEAQSLARVPLFLRLEPHELERLAQDVEQVSYKAGDVIFYEEDTGDALYVIEDGSVRIWVTDEDVQQVTLAELNTGRFFGEMAVLDRGQRSSSASAITDTHLHRLSSDSFRDFLLAHPDCAIDVICEIAARLRQTNLLVAQRASRNVNELMEQRYTLGQRVADRVAAFGGSWTFIFIFGAIIMTWMAINTLVLTHLGSGENGAQWDPYPYILLNLMLSTLAALQAPVIMMSQNRAADKDRLAAEQDFRVNLKSELMLEELVRTQRKRDGQYEKFIQMLQASQASSES